MKGALYMADTSLSNVTVRDLMNAGLHFGHQTKRWNPKMKKYIFDKRNGIHIIDITQSLELLEDALKFVLDISQKGKKILFVGTKKQAQEVIRIAAEESDMYYVTTRWLGGTLTNAQTIRKSVRRMTQIQTAKKNNNGILSVHKKEAATLARELAKLEKNLTGIAAMDKMPGALFVVDIVREANAVAEARSLGIPVIALVDTNADPDLVKFPIPGNDDSIREIKIIADCIAATAKAGAETYSAVAAEEMRKAEAEKAAKRAEKGEEKPKRTRRAPAAKGEEKAKSSSENRRKNAAAAKANIEKRAKAAREAASTAAEVVAEAAAPAPEAAPEA